MSSTTNPATVQAWSTEVAETPLADWQLAAYVRQLVDEDAV